MKINYDKYKSLSEKWEKATLADGFIFYKVMTSDPELCRRLLEILLGKKIRSINFVQGEKTVDVDCGAKGIRTDVYVEGEDEVYDIEMQVMDRKNLPFRCRYYRGIMDVDSLEKGMDFRMLPRSYIIFICMFDPFDKGYPVYTFRNICIEDGKTEMGDGTTAIFFNAKKYATMPDRDKENFFLYLCENKEESDYERVLGSKVDWAKRKPTWRKQFMTWEMELKAEHAYAKQLGLEEGIEQGKNMEAVENAITVINKFKISREDVVKEFGLTDEQTKMLDARLEDISKECNF